MLKIFIAKTFANFSYYIILLLFLYWIYFLVVYLKKVGFSMKAFLKTHIVGILFSLALCVVIFTVNPPHFKILSDESNLLGVSKSMFYSKTVLNALMGKFYSENFYPIFSEIPQRLLLFPFFINLFHQVFGYNPSHAFYLNFLTLFCLFLTCHIIVRNNFDTIAGIASVLLIASNQALIVYGTGAGYDIFSTLFMLFVFVSLYFFMADPGSSSFALLWCLLLMLANIRYENFIFFFLVIFLLFALNHIRLDFFKNYRLFYVVTPIFFLPLAAQMYLTHQKYNALKKTAELFSMDNFIVNLELFIKGQFDFGAMMPHATLLHILFFISCLVLIFRIRLLELKTWKFHFYFITSLCILVNLVVFLCHQLGVYAHPNQARFFITITTIFCLSPVIIKIAFRNSHSYWLLAVAILSFLHYFPRAIENKFLLDDHYFYRETKASIDYLKKNYPDKNVMVIHPHPGIFTSLNYGAIHNDFANKNIKMLQHELKRHLYRDIVVIQEIFYDYRSDNYPGGLLPHPKYFLDLKLKLRTQFEMQNSDYTFIRISKVDL